MSSTESQGRCVVVDSSNLSAPGADRGLGAYARSWLNAYEQAGISVNTVSPRNLPDRVWQVTRSQLASRHTYHAMSVYALPPIKTGRWIVSIQDVIPLDISEYSNLGLKSWAMFRLARSADSIVTNSSYTYSRVSEKLKVSPASRNIIPLPVKQAFFNGRFEQNCGYVAALVDYRSPDPRKRSHWLQPIAKALQSAGVELRVTGRGLDRARAELDCAVITETHGDDELVRFLSEASIFLYTSAYEGQGLPPLEAMACGTPVIAFDNTSISEMVGPGTSFLLNDPIPWTKRCLHRQIPRSSVDEVVDLAVQVVSDESKWRVESAAARLNAERFRLSRFVHQVAEMAKAEL